MGAEQLETNGIVWCSLASLQQLLPIVELNKEFTDFFNDPLRDNLGKAQLVFFSIYAVWGWVLGLLLLAAMAGLTQYQ
jgi:hypothetical protein